MYVLREYKDLTGSRVCDICKEESERRPINRTRILLIFICLMLASCASQPQLDSPETPPLVLKEGWQLRWGDSPVDKEGIPVWTYSDLDNPDWEAVSSILHQRPPDKQQFHWLRIRLPQTDWREPVLFLPSVFLSVQIFLEDRALYTFGSFQASHSNRFSPFIPHRVLLPLDCYGKFMYLRMFSNVPDINGIEGLVYLGARESLLPWLIKKDMGTFLVSVFCIIVGLFALATCLDPSLKRPYAALSFGFFSLFIGLAFLSRIGPLLSLAHAPALWYFTLFTSFFLFPAALVAFVDVVIGPGYKLYLRRLWQAHLILFIPALILDVTGNFYIPQLAGFLRFLWALDTISVLAAAVFAAGKGKREARIMLLGLGSFSALALHDMFGAPLGIWLMPAGTFVFIISLGVILFHRFTENSRRLQLYSQELEEKSQKLEDAKQELEDYSRTLESKVEERTSQVREKHAQLVQSSKMAALGSLVAGVAHEINTPVGAINSMHNTLMRAIDKLKTQLGSSLSEEEEEKTGMKRSLLAVDEANQVISSGTERVIEIVKRLRSIARLDEAELKDANINEGLEDTLTMIHHEIKHNLTIHKDFGELPLISCYPGRLNQVFLNLLINARQAIKGEGEIFISTRKQDQTISIEIRDTGTGISPEDLVKIFDPGFTTKGVGVGTGLGLSICYQIIQDHRGEIKAESELGKGTTFTVTLPMDLEKKLEKPGPS